MWVPDSISLEMYPMCLYHRYISSLVCHTWAYALTEIHLAVRPLTDCSGTVVMFPSHLFFPFYVSWEIGVIYLVQALSGLCSCHPRWLGFLSVCLIPPPCNVWCGWPLPLKSNLRTFISHLPEPTQPVISTKLVPHFHPPLKMQVSQ